MRDEKALQIAKVPSVTTLGRTVLHAAVRPNSIDCFELLLDAGANPTLRTS
ncbi:MAG: ankyrin repeat domain-containing protein [Paracoccaceae bacterium]